MNVTIAPANLGLFAVQAMDSFMGYMPSQTTQLGASSHYQLA